MIETNRLKIYAASQDTMESFIEAQTAEVLKAAYTEMLNGCLEHPDQWDWYAIWMIEMKDGTHIGELCFKGLSADGIAEIGYGISEEYQNNGYATEAVRAVLEWAFSHPEVAAVETETDSDNTASIRVLEKCQFALNGIIGEERPRWVVSKCKILSGKLPNSYYYFITNGVRSLQNLARFCHFHPFLPNW